MIDTQNFILQQDDFLNEEECGEIIDFFHSKPDHHNIVSEHYRRDTALEAAFHNSFEDIKYNLDKQLQQEIYKYNNEFWLPQTTFNITGYKIQKSQGGGGFTGWHHETQGSRYAAWMIYLNDCNSGHTEFKFQKLSFIPKRGTLLIWPAGWTHLHRGSPKLKSDKYVITGWIEHDENQYNPYE